MSCWTEQEGARRTPGPTASGIPHRSFWMKRKEFFRHGIFPQSAGAGAERQTGEKTDPWKLMDRMMALLSGNAAYACGRLSMGPRRRHPFALPSFHSPRRQPLSRESGGRQKRNGSCRFPLSSPSAFFVTMALLRLVTWALGRHSRAMPGRGQVGSGAIHLHSSGIVPSGCAFVPENFRPRGAYCQNERNAAAFVLWHLCSGTVLGPCALPS